MEPDAPESNLDEQLKAAADQIQAGDVAAGIEALEQLSAENPDSPLPLHDLGAAYMLLLGADLSKQQLWEDQADEQDAYLSATEAFTEALEIDPDFVPSMNNLASLKAMREEYVEAVSLWERSLQINPGQPELEEDLEEARKILLDREKLI